MPKLIGNAKSVLILHTGRSFVTNFLSQSHEHIILLLFINFWLQHGINQ